jgi:hypothetical protein
MAIETTFNHHNFVVTKGDRKNFWMVTKCFSNNDQIFLGKNLKFSIVKSIMEVKLHPIKWLNPSVTKFLITQFV